MTDDPFSTDEPFPDQIVVELGDLHQTLPIRLPRSTIGEMDREIAADPRYMSDRNEFVYCAVRYALYCISYNDDVDWILEDSIVPSS
jgi:hypothetical protein